MPTTDVLFDRALSASGDERDALLAEIDDTIRYADDPTRVLPTQLYDNTVALMCGTCGYTTDAGLIDDRDDAHLKHDGAHEPGWYDENADDVTLIRSDLDLIRAVIRKHDAESENAR